MGSIGAPALCFKGAYIPTCHSLRYRYVDLFLKILVKHIMAQIPTPAQVGERQALRQTSSNRLVMNEVCSLHSRIRDLEVACGWYQGEPLNQNGNEHEEKYQMKNL